MTNEATEKWNQRYRTDLAHKEIKPRVILSKHRHRLHRGALVLDIAMGAGGNAAYLQENGMRVVGMDISDVAVRAAKRRTPGLMAVVGDVTVLSPPGRIFDAILNFYYLDRGLIRRFPAFLKPGGLVFMETLTRGMLEVKPDLKPDYLLEEGELKNLFSGWEILDYGEGVVPSSLGSEKAIAWIVACLAE